MSTADAYKARKALEIQYQTESIAKLGTWEFNIDTKELYWSEGVYLLAGFQPGEVEVNFELGMSVIHPEDRERALAVMQEAMTTGKEYSIRKRFLRQDGTVLHIFSKGKFEKNAKGENRLIGVFQDISDLVRTQVELNQVQNKFEIIARSINGIFWEADAETLHFTFISDQAEELLGYNSSQWISDPQFWANHIHPDDKDFAINYCHIESMNGRDHEFEYRMRKSDGEYLWFRDMVKVVRDENGNKKLRGVMIDISESKRSAQELKILYDDLQRKAKELSMSNAELEHFAYIASHDLQEPLRMISSFLTQIEKNYKEKLDEKGKQYIHFAVDGAKRMRQIIMDLLEYSRVGKGLGAPESIDLNRIIEEVLNIHDNVIEETKAKVHYSKLPVIHGFKTPITQIFQNLIGNALKYRNEHLTPEVSILFEEQADFWIFKIVDNGIGIDAKYFERIFVLFQRLYPRTKYSGTGIGLAITKKIIENLGGEIRVESELGKGSTFIFKLPKITTNKK